jgi:hypothetical protein
LTSIIPAGTARAWETIAAIVPRSAYLGGGTAIAVHIQHRVSHDLDFFYHGVALDLDAVEADLSAAGPFAVTDRASGTLNGVFIRTKLQFLNADDGAPQRTLEPPTDVEGIRVAGLRDLAAMKLKVIAQRGELRDYFDLMAIEQQTRITAEEGLTLYLARYRPRDADSQVAAIIRALGYLDDVDEDLALPSSKLEIESYWKRRQPDVLRAAGRLGR